MMQREVDCACILEDTVCESLRIPPATKKRTRREAKRILPKTPRSAPMEPSPRIASALDVLRRVPPFDLKQNATALCTLLSRDEEEALEFLQRILPKTPRSAPMEPSP